MAKRRNSAVFLDVSIDGDPAERIIFELYHDIAPNTAENFRSLCTGEKGIGPKSGKPLHYKGSFFHRIVSGSLAQGGDIVRRDGTGGESIYAETFPVDVPRIKHDAPGILSMANADRDSNGSQFLVTFKSNHHLDRRCTAFGKIVEGHKVLKKIEGVGDEEGMPSVTVKIINSGELLDDKKKAGKVKGCVKDFFDDENKNDIKKGKRKKSSSKKGRKKKRRKYSTSESDTSSDTETETSESNTDSLSSDSSSYISSSSDDRHKRHKRASKRDKYRHLRKRDKRRDKKRKRHDKKSKRHSKRSLDSDTDVESVEKSGSSSDVNQNGTPRRSHDKTLKCTAGEKPPLKGGSEVSYVNRKMEEGILLEGQKGRSPMINGEQWSCGVGVLNNSFGVANKQLDLVNQPMKSRSESSRKTMSKSMSISPGRSLSRSPGVSRKQNPSLSPSRSPCDSENSGSPANPIPARTRRERSFSKSPSQDDYSRRISGSRDKLALLQQGRSRTPVRIATRKSLSKSPPRGTPRGTARKSISRSPVKSHRSLSRSSGRPALRKSLSVSPNRPPSKSNWHGYPNSRGAAARSRVRSPPSDHGRSVSRSPSSDESPKRIRRGRGFSERYSYARRYRTRSPEHRYGSRYDRDRYSGYRRYSDRSAWGYRSPPRVRSPPRYRSRRSRSRSLSASRSPVRRRGRRFSRSRSPVDHSRYRASPRVERRSLSRSRSRSRSSLASQSPAQKDSSMERSRSLSESPPAKKSAGLVSYGDASPASGKR